jgi:DnaJ-class molecular chaperone
MEELCDNCDGSGEGRCDGSTCQRCKGLGVTYCDLEEEEV